MKPTSVRLPPEIVKALDEVAAAETRTRSQQIIRYIIQGLKADGKLR